LVVTIESPPGWSLVVSILRALKIDASTARARCDSKGMNQELKITRERMVELLNEDLAREFQAVIAYTVYSQTLKGAAFSDIARELAVHATEELSHAMQITRQIDYFNGKPTMKPAEVKISANAEDMLRFDLENERVTILHYRERIRQAEAMGEFGLSEVLRKIIAQEQEHLTDLAGALGIENPTIEGSRAQ
jgi:bacterioferritin